MELVSTGDTAQVNDRIQSTMSQDALDDFF